MTLLNTARALDDERFIWRVRAAILRAASEKAFSEDPVEAEYASYVLSNPMRPVPQFESICAVTPEVSAYITVDEWNGVNTEDVPDEVLSDLADARFGWLARLTIPQPVEPIPDDPTIGHDPTIIQ